MIDLELLQRALLERGVLSGPQVGDGIVRGTAFVDAAGAEVVLIVDPEVDDDEEPAAAGDLVAAAERIVALSEGEWAAIVASIVAEIEDAVGDEPVRETTRLEDDLRLQAVVVLSDAVLLAFDAPTQFPGSTIRVQLDADLRVDDLEVDSGAETVAFDDLDGLLDHVTDGEG